MAGSTPVSTVASSSALHQAATAWLTQGADTKLTRLCWHRFDRSGIDDHRATVRVFLALVLLVLKKN